MQKNELVTPLPWRERISAMPYLPGGADKQTESLRFLLSAIREAGGMASSKIVGFDGKERSLRESVKQIAPAGLVRAVDRNRFELTEEANRWMDDNNALVLVSILHRHVRCVGELLDPLSKSPVDMRGLSNYANEKYDMGWRSLDQVRRRIGWFRSLGIAEYRTQTSIEITDFGLKVSRILQAGGPMVSAEGADLEKDFWDIVNPALIERASQMNSMSLESRAGVLGFIPKGPMGYSPSEAIARLLDCTSPSVTRKEFLSFCMREFSIGESSFQAVLSSLINFGLIEETSLGVYSPTEIGAELMANPAPVNLVIALHCRIKFMLELVNILDDASKASDIARRAAESKLMSRVDIEGVRRRIQILESAGLIEQRSAFKYRPTAWGKELCSKFPAEEFQADSSVVADVDIQPLEADKEILHSLIEGLRKSSTESTSPEKFESSIASAFDYMGLDVKLIGGSGDTDVLLSATDASGKVYRCIVDAKSAASGNVLEGSVNFDVIKEHRKKNRADFAILIGPGFSSGRVSTWAKANSVVLVTVDDLVEDLKKYKTAPISPYQIIQGFESNDTRDELAKFWKDHLRRINLLLTIVNVLRGEFVDQDEVTHGALSTENIYFVVRDQMETRPTKEDINHCMEFLSNPLIHCVKKTSRGYTLFDPPQVVSRKILALSKINS